MQVGVCSGFARALSGTKTLRFIKRCNLKRCDLGALKERGQCDLGDCVPKHSLSSCDLRFIVATCGLPPGAGLRLGNLRIAKRCDFAFAFGRSLSSRSGAPMQVGFET